MIPCQPLARPDGLVAASSVDKAEVFASFFTGRMRVPDTNHVLLIIQKTTIKQLKSLSIEIKQYTSDTDVNLFIIISDR